MASLRELHLSAEVVSDCCTLVCASTQLNGKHGYSFTMHMASPKYQSTEKIVHVCLANLELWVCAGQSLVHANLGFVWNTCIATTVKHQTCTCRQIKVAGNHVNEIHDFCKQLNFSRLGCLCRRHFALCFACLTIDIEHGKF